jgi:hypothetical protein
MASSSVAAEPKIKADRTPLTYRDCGLYCDLKFQQGQRPQEDDGVTNMLPPERAASTDSPWSFYIVQGAQGKDAELIKRMAANGKKVIVRALIGRLDPHPKVEEMEQRLVTLLKEIDPDWLYAITLDEEQGFWDGWSEALTELYHRAKKRWPDLPVYQWWTPMEVPNARATSGWVALPADGWVIDLYGRGREEFEKKVVMALETGKPLIHIVWSSPEWPALCGAKSWEEGGRKIFDDQLDICRGYNVPVAHFCTQKSVCRDGKILEVIRWGWHAVDPVVRNWYRQIEVMARNTGALPEETLGFRSLDKKKFDWAHRSTPWMLFSLDERGRQRVSIPIALNAVPLTPGEHPISLAERERYFEVTCILDNSASYLKPGMAVAAAPGRAVNAELIFRIEPTRPVTDLTLTANAYANADLGGAVSLSGSADGKSWSEPVRSDPKTPKHTLAVQRPTPTETEYKVVSRFSKDPLWVRVQLAANPGTGKASAASLPEILLTAAVRPPLN